MYRDRDRNSEHQAAGPIRRVEWTLISAMPYPVTGETVNIGIIYEDEQGRHRLAKGPYRRRLEAFAPESAIRRAIDTELDQLERSLEEAGSFDESRHIVRAERSTLVHSANKAWVTNLLNQMVPGHSGDDA